VSSAARALLSAGIASASTFSQSDLIPLTSLKIVLAAASSTAVVFSISAASLVYISRSTTISYVALVFSAISGISLISFFLRSSTITFVSARRDKPF